MQPSAALLTRVWRGVPAPPQNAPLAQYLGDVGHNVKERVVMRMCVAREQRWAAFCVRVRLMRGRPARVCRDVPAATTRRAACSAASATPRCSPA